MTATADSYACRFASERLLAGIGGQPPFKGCGISTDWHGTDMATLGESSMMSSGRIKPAAARKDDLARGWRAFRAAPDTNGIPDTSDLVRIHRGMFKGLPDPDAFHTRDFDDVVSRLDGGDAVSIALRLSALGASNTVDETTADHQVLMFRRRGDRVTVMGPMRAQRESYHGHLAKLSEIRTASKAIEGGLVLTWLYPIGGWTQAALQTEALRDRLRDEREKVVSMSSKVEGQTERIERLQAALEACRDGQGNDCSGPIAAALETERIAIREIVDDRRSL
jgi:hypothetical protein